MAGIPTRDEAWDLLTEYNKDNFHQKHAMTVERVMRWYAEKLGYGANADFWGLVGLLHDLDFEMYPEQHCIKEQEIMRSRGIDERIIHATASHGWKLTVVSSRSTRWRRCCTPLMNSRDLSAPLRSCARQNPCRISSLNR